MITQLGCPSLFFTLSATDTKWPKLHNLMPIHSHSRSSNEHCMNLENFIYYPHIVATFMHHRFNIFREEVIQKYVKAEDFWYRFVFNFFLYFFKFYYDSIYIVCSNYIFIFFIYEWKHRGSAHIHGFLWLEGAPRMEILNWSNSANVQLAKIFFDKYVTTWNPRDIHCHNIMVPRRLNDDPCLLNTRHIFSSNPRND